VARASAYWNASNFEAQRGSVANAVPLAARALALLGEGQDARNLARLRANLGRMQLELDPPEVPEALRNLEQAAEELVWSSASIADIADANVYIARAHYLEGDLVRADEMCAEIIATIKDESPLLTAELLRQAGFQVLRTDSLFFFPRLLKGLRFSEPFLGWTRLGAQYLVLAARS